MIEITRPGLRYYADKIAAREPFSFVRYGEGEIKWMIPALPTKSKYKTFRSPNVGRRLARTLQPGHTSQRYLVGLQHLWHFGETGRLDLVEKWFAKHIPARTWHWAGVFRNATLAGEFYPIIDALRQQTLPIVLVGPARIANVKNFIQVDRHIVTHPTHALQQIATIKESVLSVGQPALFSFSCSFTAKFLIHDLFPKLGEKSTMIDFGSLWDGYCDVVSRPYHRKMGAKLFRMNTKGNR